MEKILFSLTVVFSGLLTGYLIRRTGKYRTGTLANSNLRRRIQKFVILAMNPVAFSASIWILDLSRLRLLIIPLAGVIAISAGGTLAFYVSRLLKMDRGKAGSFFCCGLFTNIGNIGALVCYSFLGERGYALVPFYKLFEELLYYTAGFPIAARFGRERDRNEYGSDGRRKKIKFDPMVFTVLASTAAGFSLNLSGLERPDFFIHLNAVVIPLSSFLMLLTIGMAMRFGAMKKHFRQALALLPVKHFAVPLMTFLLALFCGLGEIEDGLAMKVVLILSSMPVGVLALIPPALYDLDLDFANACWFTSTIFMVVTVPVLRILTI